MKINKKYITYIIAVLIFIFMASNDIYVPSLPQMVKDFSVSPNIVNLTLSAFFIGAGLSTLLADIISCRFGRKKTILMCIALFTIVSFLIPISHSIYVIIILRLLQSVGPGMIVVLGPIVCKDIMQDREQVNALATMMLSFMISPAVAPVVGASLAKYFGWESCFYLISVCGVILFTLFYKTFPETLSAENVKHLEIFKYIKTHFILLKNKDFVWIVILATSGFCAYYIFIGISSYLYISKLGVSPIKYSYVYIFIAVSYFLGNRLLVTFNNKQYALCVTIYIGVITTLIGAILISISDIFNLFFTCIFIAIGACLMRAANALVSPSTQVLIGKKFSKNSGTAIGILMFISIEMESVFITIVTMFHTHPLFGLGLLSIILSIIGILAYYKAKSLIES